jgi:hypothetical protein
MDRVRATKREAAPRGEELATTQGGGERGCESAPWPWRDYFRAANASAHIHLPQLAPKALSPGQNGRGVKLATHLYLVSRLRMHLTMLYILIAWCLLKHRENF